MEFLSLDLQCIGNQTVPPPKDAIPALTDAFEADESKSVQIETAVALCRVDPTATKTAVPFLVTVLTGQKDLFCRWDAAKALGRVGPDARGAIPDLVTALKTDKESYVREFAAAALGLMGPAGKDAIPALTLAFVQGDEGYAFRLPSRCIASTRRP